MAALGQQARRLGLPDDRLCYRAAIYYSSMTEIYIKVNPAADEFKIEPGQIPKIYLENPAEKGKANTELKNRLEEITSAKIGIVSGAKSRRKKLKIDISEQKFREKLEER